MTMALLKSVRMWQIVMLAAFGHLTHAHTECTVDDVQRAVDDLPLTDDDLTSLCPDWETNPAVVIQHATHCGGNPKKTANLEKSIKNQLFGGKPNPQQASASMSFEDPYDCTARCVKNSEKSGGYFKFKLGADCFQYRRIGMCGGRIQKDYARERESRLCDGVTTLDAPTCVATTENHTFPRIAILSTDYTVSYSTTISAFNVDPDQNVFLVAYAEDAPGERHAVFFNNYHTVHGPEIQSFCGDPNCTYNRAVDPGLYAGLEYDVTLHYHHGLLDASVCFGVHCVAKSNARSEIIDVETNVDFQMFQSNRTAQATICNLKVVDHDYQGWGRRAARALASTTDNKHTQNTPVDCELCMPMYSSDTQL